MPKARKRSGRPQATTRSGKATMVQMRESRKGGERSTTSTTDPPTSPSGPRNQPFFSPGVRGPQSLIMPGMVALGCWLMAFTLFFLSSDPNRSLFGGMAMLMAALWTFSFGTRVRKLLLLRQRM